MDPLDFLAHLPPGAAVTIPPDVLAELLGEHAGVPVDGEPGHPLVCWTCSLPVRWNPESDQHVGPDPAPHPCFTRQQLMLVVAAIPEWQDGQALPRAA